MEDYSDKDLKRTYTRALRDLRDIQRGLGKYLKMKGENLLKWPRDVNSSFFRQTIAGLENKADLYKQQMQFVGRIRKDLIRLQIKHPGDKWGMSIGDDELDN